MEQTKPNILIVLTDDQGYGDLSCHGNPVLKTPNTDRLHAESVRFTDFHVAPMCTPTRCQLMTGLSSLVGGACAVDGGRAMMRREHPTMAEIFGAAGYRTGLFGKWHLGDNYPYRPEDRGFQEAVHHPAFGITSTPDYWNNDYFDDTYTHNGVLEPYQGYCTDVWFSEAMKWMRSAQEAGEPFLAYIATNAPHGPLFVGDDYRKDYGSESVAVASFFGMIACIDENLGRLETMLTDTGLKENTILIFMTDNGGTVGVNLYNAGMRGRKTTLYEGGHRVPCFLRWPAGGLRAAGDVPAVTQAQDILPTLLDLCGVAAPPRAGFDGTSLAGILRGDTEDVGERMLVVQYGSLPNHPFASPVFGEPCKWDCTVMWERWRLVYGNELYDIHADPGQQSDVAAENAEIVGRMREHYERWWSEREPDIFDWCYIPIGAPQMPEVCLTSHTWLAPVTSQSSKSPENSVRLATRRCGPWNISVEQTGRYRISLRRWPKEADAPIAGGLPEYEPADMTHGPFPEGRALPITQARIEVQGQRLSCPVGPGDTSAELEADLERGTTQLHSWFCNAEGSVLCGAYYAYVRRVGEPDGVDSEE
jgi:arylsulfatase A-like enzyme